MKQRCIQCGKKFEHAPEFVKVYTDKKLEPPKRCLECLRKNRATMGKVSGAKNYKHSTVQIEEVVDIPIRKMPTKFVLGVLAACIIVVALAVFGGSKISDSYISNYTEFFAPSSGNGDIRPPFAIGGVGKDDSDEEHTIEIRVENHTDDNTDDAALAQNTTEDSQDSDEEKINGTDSEDETSTEPVRWDPRRPPIVKETETVTETETESDEPEEPKGYTFKNQALKDEHYKKHGIEMGFANADEYEKAASNVVKNPKALHKKEAEDGDDVYYLEATNEFVIMSRRGYIRTYFLPDAGKAYYDRQ